MSFIHRHIVLENEFEWRIIGDKTLKKPNFGKLYPLNRVKIYCIKSSAILCGNDAPHLKKKIDPKLFHYFLSPQ